MKSFIVATSVVVGLSVLTGCAGAPVSKNLVKMDVDFNWTSRSGCSAVSPPINLSNVPAGTQQIKVHMIDKQYPMFNHGGGEVTYAGNTLPEGALKSYYGPCPPNGSHDYEMTVNALDANGVVVGRGKAVRAFSK